MDAKCDACAKCEAHGYPPEGAPDLYEFTVHLTCGEDGRQVNPWNGCEKHVKGQPRIVRDDADW